MNHRRNSSEQQRQHHHHHRQHQPTKQEIHILMDKKTSQFQVSIKSDGPIDTTVVVDPAVLTINSSSSPSSPSPSPPPLRTFSSSGWNSPVHPTVPNLPPPPTTTSSSTLITNR